MQRPIGLIYWFPFFKGLDPRPTLVNQTLKKAVVLNCLCKLNLKSIDLSSGNFWKDDLIFPQDWIPWRDAVLACSKPQICTLQVESWTILTLCWGSNLFSDIIYLSAPRCWVLPHGHQYILELSSSSTFWRTLLGVPLNKRR